MTKYLVDDQTLTDIADAIREKTEDSNPIMLSNFASAISGISGGSHTYSTTEQEVGTWIDGSTIYEKTIFVDGLPNNSSKNISTPTGLSLLIDAEGVMYGKTATNNQRTLPFCGGGTNDVRIDLNSGTLRIVTFSNWSSYDAYITIRYTKASASLLSMSPAQTPSEPDSEDPEEVEEEET